jgi:hypothetical protein
MIKELRNSHYVVVTPGPVMGPFVNLDLQSPGQAKQGDLRMSGFDLQVYNNHCWQEVSGTATNIELSSVAVSAIQWVLLQMSKEDEYKRLAKNNITVKDALEQHDNSVTEAREKLMVVVALASKQS